MSGSSEVTQRTLEQYLLGELSPAASAELGRRLNEDAGLRARLGELEAANADFLRRFPPEQLVPRIRQRLQASSHEGNRHGVRLRGFVGALAAMGCLLVVALNLPSEPRPGADQPWPEAPGERLKGPARAPALTVHRKRAQGAEQIEDGARVQPGDVLQLSYAAAGQGFGAIVSIDGAGAVSLHFPPTPSEPPTLRAEGEVALPFAYRLDDTPGFERFVFVTASEPFDVRAVLDAAKKAAAKGDPSVALELPASVHQVSRVLWKGGR